MSQAISMSPEQLKKLIREAVREELNAAGLRVDEPDHQDEARADFTFVRKLRKAYEGTASRIGGAFIIAIVSGFLLLVWNGFKMVVR